MGCGGGGRAGPWLASSVANSAIKGRTKTWARALPSTGVGPDSPCGPYPAIRSQRKRHEHRALCTLTGLPTRGR